MLISGSLVALCGCTIDSGKFAVEDYCFSGLPYQTVPNLDQYLSKGEDWWDSFFEVFSLALFAFVILIHEIYIY